MIKKDNINKTHDNTPLNKENGNPTALSFNNAAKLEKDTAKPKRVVRKTNPESKVKNATMVGSAPEGGSVPENHTAKDVQQNSSLTPEIAVASTDKVIVNDDSLANEATVTDTTLTETHELDFAKEKKHNWFNPLAPTSFSRFVLDVMIIFGVAFLISIFFSRIVFEPMYVYGKSMYPTLNKFAKGLNANENTDIVYLGDYGEYKRGDIVVFLVEKDNFPELTMNEDTNFIKRIIGLPGETVRIQRAELAEGSLYYYDVYINGEKLDESGYINERIVYSSNPVDIQKEPEAIRNLITNHYSEVTLGLREYFCMGDNRNHSTDSRVIGVIKDKDIRGRVYIHIEYGKNFIYVIIHSIKKGYLFGWGYLS